MKSALGKLLLMSAMMGGMGMVGHSIKHEEDEPPTDAQRKMFTQPVKLNKKQKAKRRQQSKA